MNASAVYKTLLDALGSRLASKNGGASRVLLIADENCPVSCIPGLGAIPGAGVLTNRYDLARQCEVAGVEAFFSDFDFAALPHNYDIFAYRLSKERPVCHHVFNRVSEILPTQGMFIVAGKKNEGIKTFHQKLVSQLPLKGKLNKDKDHYLAWLTKSSSATETHQLDDKDYPQLRGITVNALTFFSKPGLYGWNKVDRGSEFLIAALRRDYAASSNTVTSALDLGCGYGYLGMQLLQAIEGGEFPQLTRMWASDNNAAAIEAATKNLSAFEPNGQVSLKVTADDCGARIDTKFDLLLCNPPFHRGFDNSRALTEKFLRQARRLLQKNGAAYFVVNSFIPLEALARPHFENISLRAKNAQFKVLRLQSN